MESLTVNESDEILHDLTPLVLVYRDGRVVRLEEAPPVPATLDPVTGVESKDVIIFPERGVSVRLYKPNLADDEKFPVVVFFHGGGFLVQSTFGEMYHSYLNNLAGKARTLIVSVEYRLAPEHTLPAGFHDCFDALDWVISHHTIDDSLDSRNSEAWLLENADYSRMYLAGDSAGGSIVHYVAMRVGNEGLANGSIHGIINGVVLCHPFFWGKDRIGDEATKLSCFPNPDLVDNIWAVTFPGSSGLDDPWINPAQDPSLSRLGCERVLIFVAEKDVLRDRGLYYKELLEKSGWHGKVEVVEYEGEGHVFHLFNPSCANSLDLMTRIVHFLNPTVSNRKAV